MRCLDPGGVAQRLEFVFGTGKAHSGHLAPELTPRYVRFWHTQRETRSALFL